MSGRSGGSLDGAVGIMSGVGPGYDIFREIKAAAWGVIPPEKVYRHRFKGIKRQKTATATPDFDRW